MINNNFSPSIDKAIKAIKICGFDFLEKLILQHKRFSFLSLLVFLPLFISISLEANNLISLDRSVWISGQFQKGVSGKDLTPYLATFPISFFLVTLLTIRFFSKIIVKKSYQLTMGWILLVLIFNFILGNVSEMFIKIIGAMTIFLSSILVFDEYFSRLSSRINNAKEKVNVEDFYILNPFFLVAFILLLSHIIYRDDTLIFPWLKIYSFDQYMTYSLFIFVGVLFRNKWQLIFSFAVVAYFAYASRSDGIKIMLILLSIGYFIYLSNFNWLKKYSLNFMKFAIFCTILLQFFSYYLYSVRDFLPFSLKVRVEIIFEFYNTINLSHLFFPINYDIKSIIYLHNEVLTILSAVGILGVFLYYRILYNKIKIILDRNIGAAMSISIVIILGSVLVLPTLHPFTGTIIAYLVSFYSTIGNNFIKID
jgi:hypothetical protein